MLSFIKCSVQFLGFLLFICLFVLKKGNKTLYINKNFKFFRTCARVRGASQSQCVYLELSWSVWSPSVWKHKQELSWGLSDVGAALLHLETLQVWVINALHPVLPVTPAKKVKNARGLQGFSTFFQTQAQKWIMNCSVLLHLVLIAAALLMSRKHLPSLRAIWLLKAADELY